MSQETKRIRRLRADRDDQKLRRRDRGAWLIKHALLDLVIFGRGLDQHGHVQKFWVHHYIAEDLLTEPILPEVLLDTVGAGASSIGVTDWRIIEVWEYDRHETFYPGQRIRTARPKLLAMIDRWPANTSRNSGGASAD